MGKMMMGLSKLKRMGRQMRGKLCIIKICITMLLCWDDNYS
ncbi:hypothetical protein ACP275_14G014400 [Erythranthe tilingii]